LTLNPIELAQVQPRVNGSLFTGGHSDVGDDSNDDGHNRHGREQADPIHDEQEPNNENIELPALCCRLTPAVATILDTIARRGRVFVDLSRKRRRGNMSISTRRANRRLRRSPAPKND